MNVSLAILYNKMDSFEKLVSSSQKYFDVNTTRVSDNYTTLINDDDSCIIKISPIKLKFIINDEDKNSFERKIDGISRFVKQNFKNEKIAVMYYDGDYRLS